MAEPVRPYGRRRVDVLGGVPSEAAPPTYYGRPALKPADWRWLIITYLFVGGLAGAAQVIAGILDLLGRRRDRQLVSAARYLAIAGSLLSPLLLVADLKTASRWYNMLRVVRSTSPMSIGSWALFAFGSLSGLAALAQYGADVLRLAWARTLARAVGVPAAVAGGVLATYTGSLLSATSTPLWSASYRLLPPIFGLSGTATATAALGLILERSGAPDASRRRLERLGLLAGLFELLLTLRLESVWRRNRLDAPLAEPPLVMPYRVGVLGLGMLAPLIVHMVRLLSGRELHTAFRLASIAALVGGFAQRAVLLQAGERSAERPADYFRFSHP